MSTEKSSSSFYKKVGYFCIGNLALIGFIINKLKKANASIYKTSNIITPKNILYGYIAMSGAITSPIIGYAQISMLTNIPSSFPNWFLNKYFPHSLDPNIRKPDKLNIKLLKKRIFLFCLFAFHHSIFARHSIKKWLSDKNIVPLRIERSLYMISANLFMLYMINNWNDEIKINNDDSKHSDDDDDDDDDDVEQYKNDNYLWNIPKWSDASWLIQYFPFFALTIMGMKASMTSVSQEDFAGITDAFNVNFDGKNAMKSGPGENRLCVDGYYLLVRHPEMFFNVLAFLTIPRMSVSRFTLTALFGIYVFIGIQFEEKGLIKTFGQQYIEYQKQVPQLIPNWSSVSNFVAFYTNKHA